MNQDKVIRAILEGLIEQAAHDIQEDPHRSVRKLVDMGKFFAKGRFQKQIFALIQTMLVNEQSAYYLLAEKAAGAVNPEFLKSFGLNIGLNSWTKGAKIIRKKEACVNYNIPWAITFHCGEGTLLNTAQISEIIETGMEHGIFSYLFRMDSMCREVKAAYFELVNKYKDCAFVFFMPAEIICDSLPYIRECHNLLISLDSESPGAPSAAEGLVHDKCLFGVHRECKNQKDADDITSGRWITQLLNYSCTFAFSFCRQDCPHTAFDAVSQYISQIRSEQKYPVFIMDYYSDNLLIDQIISDGPCFMGILPDGIVTRCDRYGEIPTNQNIKDTGLDEILMRHEA